MNMLRRSTNFFDQKRGSKIQGTDAAGSNSLITKSSRINTKLANGNNAPAKSPRFGCSGGASAKNLNVTTSSGNAAAGSMTPLRNSKQVKNMSSLSTARANNKGKAESVASS